MTFEQELKKYKVVLTKTEKHTIDVYADYKAAEIIAVLQEAINIFNLTTQQLEPLYSGGSYGDDPSFRGWEFWITRTKTKEELQESLKTIKLYEKEQMKYERKLLRKLQTKYGKEKEQ